MMRRMLGAPLGGTIRGGHHCLDSKALSLITPPNFIGGAVICFPSSVTVALGSPGVPVICWAVADGTTNIAAAAVSSDKAWCFSFMVLVLVAESECLIRLVCAFFSCFFPCLQLCRRHLRRAEFVGQLINRAGELKWQRVAFIHSRAGIASDVEGLGNGHHDRNGVRDRLLGQLLAI